MHCLIGLAMDINFRALNIIIFVLADIFNTSQLLLLLAEISIQNDYGAVFEFCCLPMLNLLSRLVISMMPDHR